MADEMRTLGYICPKCGAPVMGARSVFALEASDAEIECTCGGSVLHTGVHIGDFVEVKNSTVGAGTKSAHLTYIGDSDVGAGVNFGCGTVTVNYDGKNKSRCKIGDGAFIGCNTNLVAPVEVGDRAYIAAGSTITDDIPGDALSIARARQVNKPGWVTEKKPYKEKK